MLFLSIEGYSILEDNNFQLSKIKEGWERSLSILRAEIGEATFKSWFKNIQFFPWFKDLWKRKKINYDLIINLSNTPYSIFYYYISRGLKKNTLHWFNRRKISEKSNFEAESILAKKMIQKIIKNDEVELDLPSLKIEKEKLENTENLIDWLLI